MCLVILLNQSIIRRDPKLYSFKLLFFYSWTISIAQCICIALYHLWHGACSSVCHKPMFYRYGWTYRANFRHTGYLRLIPHCPAQSQLPRKGHSSPLLFGPCLLWPQSPISATAELLFDSPAVHCSNIIFNRIYQVAPTKKGRPSRWDASKQLFLLLGRIAVLGT